MDLKYQYRITCDRCHTYNKDVPDDPEHHYLCAIAGHCPGMAEGEERVRLYREQLEHEVRKGTAVRVG